MALGGFVACWGPSLVSSPVAAGLAATPAALVSLGVAFLKTLSSSPASKSCLFEDCCSIQSFLCQCSKAFPKQQWWGLLEIGISKERLEPWISCVSRAFLRDTDVWWFAFPISCKEVWIADIASAGNSNLSALSNVRTRGITASSQNCCNQLAALSAFFVAGETLAATTASILGHLIHCESGMPFLVAFNFLFSFCSFQEHHACLR